MCISFEKYTFFSLQDYPTKSHSTCSDGSLLSMDSSDMEEVIFIFVE